jgi:plasmid stabilization system protein ParE
MSEEASDYRLILQPAAEKDIEAAFRWIQDQSPSRATQWLNGLMQAIESLTVFPLSCPLAPENHYFIEEIRQLLYGKRGSVYRVLYTVLGSEIHVLHVRHGSRDVLRPPGVGLDESSSN